MEQVRLPAADQARRATAVAERAADRPILEPVPVLRGAARAENYGTRPLSGPLLNFDVEM